MNAAFHTPCQRLECTCGAFLITSCDHTNFFKARLWVTPFLGLTRRLDFWHISSGWARVILPVHTAISLTSASCIPLNASVWKYALKSSCVRTMTLCVLKCISLCDYPNEAMDEEEEGEPIKFNVHMLSYYSNTLFVSTSVNNALNYILSAHIHTHIHRI